MSQIGDLSYPTELATNGSSVLPELDGWQLDMLSVLMECVDEMQDRCPDGDQM